MPLSDKHWAEISAAWDQMTDEERALFKNQDKVEEYAKRRKLRAFKAMRERMREHLQEITAQIEELENGS